MDTVDIPLNHYTYRFRKLAYEEEFALEVAPGGSSSKAILRAAMVEVSGLPIESREQAGEILNTLPDPIISRVWVMYRTGLPKSQFFLTRGLYLAPEPSALATQRAGEQDRVEELSDRAVASMEAKFGRGEVREAQEQSQRLLDNARARGIRTPASPSEAD
jgi:hypothetical protein